MLLSPFFLTYFSPLWSGFESWVQVFLRVAIESDSYYYTVLAILIGDPTVGAFVGVSPVEP